MVCIPCIVIPVLLWVYKRFLEPILYPIISPILGRFWPKKPVSAPDGEKAKGDSNGTCQTTSSEDMKSPANGSVTVSDKKMD